MKVHKNKEQNLHISLVFFSLLHNSIEGRINSQILGVKGFNPTSNQHGNYYYKYQWARKNIQKTIYTGILLITVPAIKDDQIYLSPVNFKIVSVATSEENVMKENLTPFLKMKNKIRQHWSIIVFVIIETLHILLILPFRKSNQVFSCHLPDKILHCLLNKVHSLTLKIGCNNTA